MSMSSESSTPTPYAVHCEGESMGDFGPPCRGRFIYGRSLIYLTADGYFAQMTNQDSLWLCPRCGGYATWSDDNYEAWCESTPASAWLQDHERIH
jgi:hypothetical protein